MDFALLPEFVAIASAVLGGVVSAHSPQGKSAKFGYMTAFIGLGAVGVYATVQAIKSRGAAHIGVVEFGHGYIRPDGQFTVPLQVHVSGTEDVDYTLQYWMEVRKAGDSGPHTPDEVFLRASSGPTFGPYRMLGHDSSETISLITQTIGKDWQECYSSGRCWLFTVGSITYTGRRSKQRHVTEFCAIDMPETDTGVDCMSHNEEN